MIPTKFKNRRQKAKEALAKAILKLIKKGGEADGWLVELKAAFEDARKEKVL